MADDMLTDASLHNGQPIDTGASCPSTGLASRTSPTSEDRGGVSVENVPAGTNPPLTIPEAAMANFIRLTSIRNPNIIPITSPNIHFKLGDMVRVTEGEFQGIRGRVARIAGQQRIIVELFDGCLVATAYVPKGAMEKCSSV